MTHTYYSQETHGPYETFNLSDFDLEDGGRIRNLTLAYATFGKLSPRKDNAILFPTWYSGTSKILEQAYIGKGRWFDEALREFALSYADQSVQDHRQLAGAIAAGAVEATNGE